MKKSERPDSVRKSLETPQEGPTDRRNMLKSLLAGSAVVSSSALPETWTRPVTNALILPAHAVTTETPSTTETPGTTETPVTTAPPSDYYGV